MIYISSAAVKIPEFKKAIEILCQQGYRNIELTGGFNYHDRLVEELIEARGQYNLNLLCHNYFPPPAEPFVLNIASMDDSVYQKSVGQLKRGIEVSRKLGISKFSFHAGFFMDIRPSEIGRALSANVIFDQEKCVERFCRAFEDLRREARGMDLYVENNVVSQVNLKTFNGFNPFMLTGHADFLELKKRIDFKLLLDVGHLQVSCHSLKLNFQDELNRLMAHSDYIHISDNNAQADQNKALCPNGALHLELKKYNLKGKTITLEIYESLPALRNSYDLIEEMIS